MTRRNPFRGLAPYTEADEHRIFGRDRDLLLFQERLLAARVTLLFAASGAGKTSFLRAKVVPALGRRFQVFFCNEWSAGGCTEALQKALKKQDSRTAAALRENERAELLDLPAFQGPALKILILDQFEEVFSYYGDHRAFQDFVRQLAALMTSPEHRIHVVLSMREEFLGELDVFDPSVPDLFAHHYRLKPPDRRTARAIIERTAALSGAGSGEEAGDERDEVTVDPEGLERLVRDLSTVELETGPAEVVTEPAAEKPARRIEKDADSPEGLERPAQDLSTPEQEPGSAEAAAEQDPESSVRRIEKDSVPPPYLQIACAGLWEERFPSEPGRVAPAGTFLESYLPGTARKILGRFCDGKMDSLGWWEQAMAARAFDFLITSRGAKMAYELESLGQHMGLPRWPTRLGGGARRLRRALEKLAEAGILRRRQDPDRSAWFELYHDRFAPALSHWRDRWRRRRRTTALVVAAAVVALLGTALGAWLHRNEVNLQAQTLQTGTQDSELALGAYRRLQGLTSVSRATSHWAEYWDQRARNAALLDQREEALLLRLRALQTQDTELRRREAASLLGGDYPALVATLRGVHNFSPCWPAGVELEDGEGSRRWWVGTGSRPDLVRPARQIPPELVGAFRIGVSPDCRWEIWDTEPPKVGRSDVSTLWQWRPGRDGEETLTKRLDLPLRAGAETPFALGRRRLVAAIDDYNIRCWTLTEEGPEPVSGCVLRSPEFPNRVVLEPTEDSVLVAGVVESRILDLVSGRDPVIPALQVAGWRRGHISSVAVGLGGRLAEAQGGRILVLSAEDVGGRARATVLTAGAASLRNLSFSPDGRWLAVIEDSGGSEDVLLWPLPSDRATPPRRLGDHSRGVAAMSFSRDSHWLVTVGGDWMGRAWRLSQEEPPKEPLVFDLGDSRSDRSFKGNQPQIAFLNQDGLLATLTPDAALRIWDLDQLRLAPSTTEPVAPTRPDPPTGRWTLTESGGEVLLWPPVGLGDHGSPVPLPGFEETGLTGAAFGPSGETLWTATASRRVWRWHREGGEWKRDAAELATRDVPVQELLFLASPKVLLGRGTLGRLLFWPLSGDPAPELVETGGTALTELAVAENGRLLATGSADGQVRLWSLWEGVPENPSWKEKGHAERVGALAFSPDGRWLVSGSADRRGRLWDLRSSARSPKSHELLGHGGEVVAAAVSPDGRWALTASDDGIARLWDLSSEDPSLPLPALRAPASPVYAAAFTADGGAVLLATPRWLHLVRIEDRAFLPDVSRLLGGFWEGDARALSEARAGGGARVMVRSFGGRLAPREVALGEPATSPVQGRPEELFETWQRRLGLTMDESGRITPAPLSEGDSQGGG